MYLDIKKGSNYSEWHLCRFELLRRDITNKPQFSIEHFISEPMHFFVSLWYYDPMPYQSILILIIKKSIAFYSQKNYPMMTFIYKINQKDYKWDHY